MKWETVHACPICGENNASFYGQGHAPIISDPDVMGGASLAVVTTYVICNICGLIFQAGRLTEESAAEFYTSGFYRKSLGRPQEELDESERNTAARIAPFIKPKPGTTHLDIGCSRGYLLEATRAEGCTVLGVEPFAEYVTEDVLTVPLLADVMFPQDTITCIHVLEHMIDPVKVASQIINLLKPGGRLILEVPSEQSPGGPLRLPHYYLFGPPVILRLFAGLKLVKFDLTPHNFFIFEKV